MSMKKCAKEVESQLHHVPESAAPVVSTPLLHCRPTRAGERLTHASPSRRYDYQSIADVQPDSADSAETGNKSRYNDPHVIRYYVCERQSTWMSSRISRHGRQRLHHTNPCRIAIQLRTRTYGVAFSLSLLLHSMSPVYTVWSCDFDNHTPKSASLQHA